MKKSMVFIAGCFSFVLGLFHVYLGWKIHGLGALSPEHRALMEMLNISTGLLVFLLAIGCTLFIDEVLSTRVGRLILVFGFLLYAMRAIGEVILFPTFNVVIFMICVLVAILCVVPLLHRPHDTPRTTHASP
ncbi:MAG: hypothetical protein AB1512_06560 [Thermodesulfobacteriota bacterium]